MSKLTNLVRTFTKGASDLASRARATVAAAGAARTVTEQAHHFEQLEKRDYMFVLTIQPGQTSATANFGYFIPVLQVPLPAIPDVTVVTPGTVGTPRTVENINGTAVETAGGNQVLPISRANSVNQPRIFGASITIFGAPGDSVQIFDLFGRDMIQTLALGVPETGRPLFVGIPAFEGFGVGAEVDPFVDTALADGVPGGARLEVTGATIAPGLIAVVDPDNIIENADGDGVPRFNDGIGRIVLLAGGPNTIISMSGGVITTRAWDEAPTNPAEIADETEWEAPWTPRQPAPADFNIIGEGTNPWRGATDTVFEFRPRAGLFDAMQAAGLGFGFTDPRGAQPQLPTGLPGGLGSVIVGSPFLRTGTTSTDYWGSDLSAAGTPATLAPNFGPNPQNPILPAVPLNFTGLQIGGVGAGAMGIDTSAAASFGGINIVGMFIGQYQTNGAIGFFGATNLYGNVVVQGDLGRLVVGGQSGYWVHDDQLAQGQFNTGTTDGLQDTGNQIFVGGAVGAMYFAGRNTANVQVLGDTVNERVRINFANYTEIESILGTNPAGSVGGAIAQHLANPTTFAYGQAFFRNGPRTNAEFVATTTRTVTISGRVGQADPVNAPEDVSDTYAFAANRGERVTADVVLPTQPQIQFPSRVYVRIFNGAGQVVASHQLAWLAPEDRINGSETSVRLEFTPDTSGLYTLEVGSQIDQPTGGNFFATSQPYSITLNGVAPTTLGAYVTGGGSRGEVVSVTNGNVGLISTGTDTISAGGQRILTGGGGGTGTPWDPTGEAGGAAGGRPANGYLETTDFNVVVNGNLGGYLVGADLVSATLSIGGNVGEILGAANVLSLNATIGGTLSSFEAFDAIAYQNDASLRRQTGLNGSTVITTGASGSPGHIGRFYVGSFVNGGGLTINTSNNSTIDSMFIGTNLGGGQNDGRFVNRQPTFNLGSGSNIRFASFTGSTLVNVGQQPIQDYFLPFDTRTPISLTDDSGVSFTISVTGTQGFGANSQVSTGIVRVVPAGAGVIIGGIEVDLIAGGVLNITTNSPGTLGLDRIIVNTATAASRINLNGTANIDVRELRVNGAGVAAINNNTPRGSILSIDAFRVDNVFLQGDLGRVATTIVGVDRIAQVRGIGLVDFTGVFGSQPVGALVPSNWTNTDAGAISLEDIGSPFDFFANGMRVLTGNVQSVRANGAIGDVILQGGVAQGGGGAGTGGVLISVVANADGINNSGQFEGIIGNIVASDINTVDVGDGLLSAGETPFARASIVAYDDIGTISAGFRVLNAQMNGIIIARNITPTAQPGQINTQGIGAINIRGGSVDGMFIGVSTWDSFWRSARFGATRDIQLGDAYAAVEGTLNSLQITNTNFNRSRILAGRVNTIAINGGSWDGSSVEAQQIGANQLMGQIVSIRADNFRNSSAGNDALAYRVSSIRAGLDLGTVSVNNPGLGVISDTLISAGRRLTGGITAFDILRSDIDIEASMTTVRATRDIRQVTINASRVTGVSAGRNIVGTTIAATGAIDSIIAGGSIERISVDSTGPDGRITLLQATGNLTGEILSSGPITTVRAATGDINLAITTTDPSDGTLGTVIAGRDINLDLDIVGGVTTIQAGRNIGSRDSVTGLGVGQLFIPGNVVNIIAPGVIYSDVFVGGTLGSLSMGRALAFQPGSDFVSDAIIQASNRINSIVINGDFNGSIINDSGGIGSVQFLNGSFRAGTDSGNRIESRRGDITSVTVSRGHLLGDIFALSGSIGTISVTGDAIFGDIGINGALSNASATGVVVTERRNQLPPGAAPTANRDGPTIYASRDIAAINATGGIFEASISAGRNINSVVAGRGIDFDARNSGATTPSATHGTFIAAGDAVLAVSATQFARNLTVQGGRLLGADRLPGGAGDNADTVQSGRIGNVALRGGATNTVINAGVNAGVDNTIGNGDDRAAAGLSTITGVQILGTAANNTNNIITADTSFGAVTGITNGVNGNVIVKVDTTEAGFPTFSGPTAGFAALTAGGTNFVIGGATVNIAYTGPANTGFYDAANTRIVLNGSTAASTLRITSTATVVNGLTIVASDDSSLASLISNVPLFNAAGTVIAIDGSVTTMQLRSVTDNAAGNTAIRIGQQVNNLLVGSVATGTTELEFSARELLAATVTGGLGSVVLPSLIQVGNIGSFIVNGAFRGTLSSDRDITTLRVTGQASGNSAFRAGDNITSAYIGGMDGTRLAAGGNLGATTIAGSVNASLITSGVDLGRDGNFGGTGLNADRIGDGNIASITVTGSFTRSDIAAGVARGADNLLGTPDDRSGSGRSTIGPVTITGAATGSLQAGESFRITSNGTVGIVRAGGAIFTQNANLRVDSRVVQPAPVQISDIVVTEVGGLYTATITFNQPVDPTSIRNALRIFEQRGAEPGTGLGQQILLTAAPVGQTVIQSGADYEIRPYDAQTRSVSIRFNNNTNALAGPVNPVTNRPLVADPNAGVGAVPINAANPNAALASPGVFRFEFESTGANRLRGQTDALGLDGNGDGLAGADDDFSRDVLVGDAGDRLTSQFGLNPPPPAAGTVNNAFSFYGPANLDVLMTPNSAAAVAGRPPVNTTFTVRGVLGDHPAYNPITFDRGSDIDLFSLSVRQGQILQIGAVTGQANAATVTILNATTGDAFAGTRNLGNGSLLVTQDATIVLMVSANAEAFIIGQDPNDGTSAFGGNVVRRGDIINQPATAGGFGNYAFTVRLVDDGNNGFAGVNDESNGTALPVAPLPSSFAGVDNVLGTADDILEQGVGTAGTSDFFRLSLQRGTNNVFDGNGTSTRRSDDIITGNNRNGDVITYTSGTDGIFGTADDVVAVTSANGSVANGNTADAAQAFTDGDVWHLNNRGTIAANTRMRFTLRVTESGGNLGTTLPTIQEFSNTFAAQATDNRAAVQFALFETGGAGGIDAGRLVVAPSDIAAAGGRPNTVIADDGRTRYGYDARGDFYMEVVIPASQINPANPGTYALYVQGALASGYGIEVQNLGVVNPVTIAAQNFVIETGGGTVSWLDAYGPTVLEAFTGLTQANVPGLAGENARDYTLRTLVDNLNNLFAGAGVPVNISLQASSFVGQPFSTIFLTDSADPQPSVNLGRFGASQRVDIGNANRTDQGAVFAAPIAALGFPLTRAGLDQYVIGLTSAIARRMGELMGLRITANTQPANPVAVMSANSPTLAPQFGPAPGGAFQNIALGGLQRLPGAAGNAVLTNFVFGQQDSTTLLRRVFGLN